MRYRIGSFVLDQRQGLIWRGSSLVSKSRQLTRVLHVLAEDRLHGEGFVSQQELQRRAWGGVHVSRDAVYKAVAELRKLLGHSAESPAIETLYARGVRLRLDVD